MKNVFFAVMFGLFALLVIMLANVTFETVIPIQYAGVAAVVGFILGFVL